MNILADALPSEFTFYDLGQVSRLSAVKPPSEWNPTPEGRSALAFSLLGEQPAILLFVFDTWIASELDPTTFEELGNVIASKLCQRLSESSGSDYMISPPSLLNEAQWTRLSQTLVTSENSAGFYEWLWKTGENYRKILIQTLILPATVEEQIGHA